MPKKYHERFGIELGVDEAKRRFVNRVLNFLLDHILPFASRMSRSAPAELEKYICHKLGERYTGLGCLEKIIGKDFDKCLQVLEALYANLKWQALAGPGIESILAETEIDIGIRWENSQFRPAGAPALDATLVDDPLNLLVAPEYKGISDAFQKGLNHFLHS